MYIKQDDLVIRSATENDAQILCRWWNDGRVMEHAGFPKGLGITVEKIINQIKNDSVDSKRLILEKNNKPIGEMSYRKVLAETAEIGIKICDFSEHGKGYGTRYLKMLINYLFNNLYFTKIILDTNLLNIKAQHLYEKVGFKKVKINYDCWKDQLGRLQSSVDYELSIQDYKSKYLK